MSTRPQVTHSLGEIAQTLGITHAEVEDLVRAGKLRTVITAGERRVSCAEIVRFINKKTDRRSPSPKARRPKS